MDTSNEGILEIIFQSAAKIAQEHNFDRLLDLIADMGCLLIDCDRVSIWLIDKQTGELWTKVAQGIGRIRMPFGHGIVGEAIQNAKTIIINSPYDDPRFNRAIDNETGYRTTSILVIPMIGVSGAVIGAFQAINKNGGDFTEKDLTRLQLAATFSAKILDAEHLLYANSHMQEEQKSAALKQKSIIVNEFAGDPRYDICAFSQGSDILCGDAYALYRTKEGGALIYCVDGMGHGILPSLTSFSISGTIKQFIHKAESLQDLSEEIISALQGVLSDEEELSCAFFWLSPDQKRLDYFVAGFYPPIVQDNGKIIEIAGNNTPLMNFTQTLKVDRLELANFEKLLIYTDGLVEDRMFDFPRSRAAELLDRRALLGVCDIIRRNNMDDDVTIVYFAKNKED